MLRCQFVFRWYRSRHGFGDVPTLGDVGRCMASQRQPSQYYRCWHLWMASVEIISVFTPYLLWLEKGKQRSCTSWQIRRINCANCTALFFVAQEEINIVYHIACLLLRCVLLGSFCRVTLCFYTLLRGVSSLFCLVLLILFCTTSQGE